jgi:pyrroline-5-carboxylate reductase
MKLGLIGAGNMATALARGFGEPVLVSDVDRSRAEGLASATGGQALGSNREVAEQADAVMLCHKPAQLEDVALEIRDSARVVISILGGTPLTALELAYPDRPVYRFMPNIPAELKLGAFTFAPGSHGADGPQAEIVALFERAGTVTELPEGLIDTAMAINGCGPGLFALVIESMVDAGVRYGLTPDQAVRLAVQTMSGAAAVIAEAGHDPVALRRRVSSPGGSTARAVEALEQHGIRAAFHDAVGVVVEMTQ